MEFNKEIIDMSLDDYIAMSNKLNKVDSAANKLNSCNDFKFGRRRESIEEEDDDEQLQKSEGNDMKNDVDMEIWKGPDASIAYIDCYDQSNDLRQKLNSAKIYPNNNFDCPRGTSTIVPFNAQQRNGGFNKRNRNRNHRFNNNFNRGNNHNNSNRNYMNHNNSNRNYNNHNNNNMNYMNHNNNNRNNMNHNNNDRNYMHMHFNNKNFQNNSIDGVRTHHNSNQNFRINTGAAVNNGNNNNNLKEAISPGTSKNLIIQFPSNSIKFGQDDQHKSCLQVPNAEVEKIKTMPVGSLTPQAQAALNLESANTPSNSSNENLRSLLGFQGNVSGDMMPLFASKLMEFLQNGTQPQVVHKPIYDMKVQKDIHEIQNKPMLYKCNGGEVISADGAGVNCKVIPRSSGISLNCRFA